MYGKPLFSPIKLSYIIILVFFDKFKNLKDKQCWIVQSSVEVPRD
jgi:hypothetical protein